MGYRTVVVLNNDVAQEWSKDVGLGEKISAAANTFSCNPELDENEKLHIREGIVFKSNQSSFSFKAISNKYLLDKH